MPLPPLADTVVLPVVMFALAPVHPIDVGEAAAVTAETRVIETATVAVPVWLKESVTVQSAVPVSVVPAACAIDEKPVEAADGESISIPEPPDDQAHA